MSTDKNGRRSNDFDRNAVLEALKAARTLLIESRRGMRPKSGLARSAEAVISEIDEFALVLTGARDYFHTKAHGTPPKEAG